MADIGCDVEFFGGWGFVYFGVIIKSARSLLVMWLN